MGTQALGIPCCCSLELGQHSLASSSAHSSSGQGHSLSSHARAHNAPLLWHSSNRTSRDQRLTHSKQQRPVDSIPQRLVELSGSKVQSPVLSSLQWGRASRGGHSLGQPSGRLFGEWTGLSSSSQFGKQQQQQGDCKRGQAPPVWSRSRVLRGGGFREQGGRVAGQGVPRRQVQVQVHVRAAAGGEGGRAPKPLGAGGRARRPGRPEEPRAPPSMPPLPPPPPSREWVERELLYEERPLKPAPRTERTERTPFFEDRRIRKQRKERKEMKEMQGPFGGGDRLAAPQDHRSGYVALIGKPNAGKSTLLNSLIGQKLSIVSQKPQTTRHRILGICSEDDYQIILYDTPGVMKTAQHKLDEVMLRNVRTATMNADAVLIIVDITSEEEPVASMLQEGAVEVVSSTPTLLVLNKRDKLKPGEVAKKMQWYEHNSGLQLPVLGCSSMFGHGVRDVKDWVVRQLPRGPAYYPKDIVSEHPERFFVAEIVREKIFLQYFQEIPYATQVGCSVFVERPNPDKDYVEVDVVVEKESQKGVIIGKGGAALKQLSTAARKDIEDFLQREIFLEIRVKVSNDWRKDERLVQGFGYDSSRA